MRSMNEFTNKHKGKVLLIYGAGLTLLETDFLHDSKYDDSVIRLALNSALTWFDNKSLDYIMFTDWNIPNPKHKREYGYYTQAMGRPGITKLLLDQYFRGDIARDDCVGFNCGSREFSNRWSGKLCGGASVLMPALHWAFISGFSSIILNGCDYCTLRNDDGEWQTHWYGNVKIHGKLKDRFIPARGKDETAPNGEPVKQHGAHRKQMNRLMPRIRQLQEWGVIVAKTSVRGMLDIPYIKKGQIDKLCDL